MSTFLKPVLFFALTSVISSTFAQPLKQSSPTGNSVNLINLSGGTTGAGGDDTQQIQSAINLSSGMGKVLEIPVSPVPYNVGPLTIPSNSNIQFDPGVTMLARPGFRLTDKMINIVGVTNITIQGNGAVFQMRKADYTSGEYRHCLDIEGSSEVAITGLSCNGSGGDGVYIGPGSLAFSKDISLTDSTFSNNRRQGMSIVSGVNITVTRCNFLSTQGTSPADGIDIEPNTPVNVLQNILIQDSTTAGNDGNGVAIDVRNLNASSIPVSIQITRHSSSHNGGSGYYATNQNSGSGGDTGSITVSASSSSFDSQYGAVASFYDASGPALIFQNLTILNPNQSRSTWDNSAFSVKRGGGGQGLIGNVSFVNPSVISTNGTIENYFSFWDYSNIGFTQVSLVNPSFMGAHSGTGLLQGQPLINVSIP